MSLVPGLTVRMNACSGLRRHLRLIPFLPCLPCPEAPGEMVNILAVWVSLYFVWFCFVYKLVTMGGKCILQYFLTVRSLGFFFFFLNRGDPLTSFLADSKKEEFRVSAGTSWYIPKVYLKRVKIRLCDRCGQA